MKKFIFPYGADRNPKYVEFSEKQQSLLDAYNKNVAEKKHLQSIYLLRYIEAERELFKEYSDVLAPMSVKQYMKEFNLEIGKYYDCGGIATKLIDTEECFLIFENNVRHSVTIEFSWVECEPPLEKDKDEVQNITYDMYSDWAKSLAKNYSSKELQRQLTKCDMLTDKYIKSLHKANKFSNYSTQAEAHARNNVDGNYKRKMALSHALEIQKLFPEYTK